MHFFFCSNHNNRPIIGILSQDLTDDLAAKEEGSSYSSYIAASYVKFVESGGARVVPVFVNQSDWYYDMIFKDTNGLLIPGGTQSFDNSGKYG